MKFEPELVRLPIQFGSITLWQFRFRADTCVEHFADLAYPPRDATRDVDLVLFPSIPGKDAPHRTLRIENGRICYSAKRFPRYLADLDTDFETYLNSFSPKSRETIRRKVRKWTATAGPDHFRVFKHPAEMMDFHAQARQLSTRTYQERRLGGGLADTPRFKKEMMELAEQDQVRAYILYMDARPAAYLYAPARNRVLRYEQLGYDPEFKQLSPGAVLQYLAFEQLFAEHQFHAFDFEEGDGQHKRTFSTRCIHCFNLMVFKPGLRSSAFIFFDYVFKRVTQATLYTLDKVRLRSHVRRSIRAGVPATGD